MLDPNDAPPGFIAVHDDEQIPAKCRWCDNWTPCGICTLTKGYMWSCEANERKDGCNVVFEREH